jgi:hypothetical protein
MTAPPRARRDCRCQNAQHEHGTYLAYLSDTCRCDACTTAWRLKTRAQRRVIYAKSWGEPDTRPAAYVPARPTVLRLRALATLGYGCPELVTHIGGHVSDLSAIRGGKHPTVRRSTELRVERIYDRLWSVPSSHPRAGQTISRARKHGWAVPLDIEDELHSEPGPVIDETPTLVDDIAVERAIRGDHVRLTAAEKAEAVATLTRWGLSAAQIAQRIGTTERTVTRKRAAA